MLHSFFPLVAFMVCFGGVFAVESDFTVMVEAGSRECFFQFVTAQKTIEFEFQVIDGGELDINVMINAPSGHLLYSDIRRTDGKYKFVAAETGDFKICLDNSFSHFSQKLVYLELYTDEADPILGQSDVDNFIPEQEGAYEVKVEDIRDALDRIKARLDRGEEAQNILRLYEARDRSSQEDNFNHVNFWSALHLFIMISVGLVQVLMVRSLFEEKQPLKSKVRT